MSTSANHVGLNWLKIKSSTSDHSGFLTIDGNGTVNIDQINRFDSSYIPHVTGNGLNFRNTVPTTTTLEVGTSYTLVCLEFDAVLGSSSTVTSSNGTLSSLVVTDNCLQFSYQNTNTSDVLTIHSYSPDNSKDKWMNYTLNLTTVLAIPVSWVTAPNTKQYAYAARQMNFNRSITALSGITSSNGGTIANISVVGGKAQFDYTTPNSATDTLTFQGVNDGITVNATDVTFVTTLLDGPAFTSFTVTPQSQSYTYTAIEANFSKTVTACSGILASVGANPSNITINSGKVRFDWITGANSSVTLTFNGLVASDGSYDSGAIETATVTLSAPPSTPSWFANQPVTGSTTYNDVEVSFNKTIASVGSVTSSGTNQPSGVTIVSGRVQFDITTDSNPNVSYTFNDVVSSDGGILGSVVLTTGPNISLFTSNGNTAVGNKVLIQTAGQTVTVNFSKNIANAPTATLNVGNAVYNSGSGTSTLTYTLTNVTASTNLMSFSNVIATDSTSTSGLTQAVAPVTAQTFNRVAEQSAPLISKTTFDTGTNYNLLSVFNKSISNDLTGVSVTASAGSNPSNLSYSSADRYSFDWTPDTAGTVTLNFNNTRDVDGFVYSTPFSSNSLTINTPSPYFYPSSTPYTNYFTSNDPWHQSTADSGRRDWLTPYPSPPLFSNNGFTNVWLRIDFVTPIAIGTALEVIGPNHGSHRTGELALYGSNTLSDYTSATSVTGTMTTLVPLHLPTYLDSQLFSPDLTSGPLRVNTGTTFTNTTQFRYYIVNVLANGANTNVSVHWVRFPTS